MKISKKCQYALRAVFELAWRNTVKPVNTHEIADTQGISPRFTEIILNELKHGGFVESRRGNEGGYILAVNPKSLTVGEIIEYIEGPISVAPDAAKDNAEAVYPGSGPFMELWTEIDRAISEVCSNTTFADLVEAQHAMRERSVPNYNI